MSNAVKSQPTYKICDACGYAYRTAPERVGCVSSTHAQAKKILTRLYEFLPTRKVEQGGKVLYDVSSDELFRVIYNTALLPPTELCKQCNLSVKSDPRRYNCPSTKHLNQHLTYHRERMTRYLNSRRGGTSNKVVMSHKQVDLKNPKLKELVIHCGASLMWSNPVREVMLLDTETRLVWGTVREWTFRSVKASSNRDQKEIMFDPGNIQVLETPLTLADLGFSESVSIRLFMYVPPTEQKEGE